MSKNILVIGGTRFVGKLLVQRLLAAGHHVTIATRGRAPDPFGERIERVKLDRRDERAMHAAFSRRAFDVVYDQMCYSPVDAAISTRVFAGRVKRYVMASTIDVYRGLLGLTDLPFAEDAIDILAQPIDCAYPWHDPKLACTCYVAGKQQAEAYLYRDGSLPTVTVRIGHVLSGPEDFTNRLAHYVDLVRAGAPLRYSNAAAGCSFVNASSVADFLAWAGMQTFIGPVNAASDGPLSSFELFHRVGALLEAPTSALPVTEIARAGDLSPFDYAFPFVLDTTRARTLGYRFSHTDDWLDDTIRQHDLAFV